MFFLILLVSVVAALSSSVYIYLTWNFNYWSKRGVPSAKPKILLGNLPNSLLQREHLTYDFEKIYSEFKGKAPFVGIIQIRAPRLIVIEPELVKDVTVRKFKNFHDNEFGGMINKEADPLYARNPFFLEGEAWKEKRAEITPAFTVSRMRALYPLIKDVKDRMIEYIKATITNEEPIDARELCAKYTVDVVSNSIFGIDAQSFTSKTSEIREMGRRLVGPEGVFFLKMYLVGAVPFLKWLISMRFMTEDVEEFFINLMKQAASYREENKVKREDFLDYLIQLKKEKNIEEIDMAAHTLSFFNDGFETSSVAIAHVLYELGMNKKAQEKLRNEVEKHSDNDGKMTFEALTALPYLDQVWNETLRMHPPNTFISRVCTGSINLEYDGKIVPVEKGINVYIPVYQLHYDPEYYPEPDKFNPERFNPENGGIKVFKNKGVFLPFGDGPRICLGIRFAEMQSKAAIVGIVRNFNISVNPKTAQKLIISPKEFINVKRGGLWLDFSPISF